MWLPESFDRTCIRGSFRYRIDQCRWDSAADWLDAGDADLYHLEASEVELLNKRLTRRFLRIVGVGPEWHVERVS